MGGLVFAAPEPTYHPLEYDSELIWVPRDDETRLELGVPCLLLQHPGARRMIIFFHANAEDLGQVYVTLRYLRSILEMHVIGVEYPGYGICSGSPSEETVLADAESVIRFVQERLNVPLNRVIVMGRSIGGGPAIHLASRYACAGLVTLSAFCSIRGVVATIAGWGGWFPSMFENETNIRRVHCPTLIVHGRLDNIVSVEQAYLLADACGAEVVDRKSVVLVIREELNHNDFDMQKDILDPVQQTFPALREGDVLSLGGLRHFLELQPEFIPGDVLARVPWKAGWIPNVPPRCEHRMSDVFDGQRRDI